MVNALVLLNVDRNRVNDVAEKLSEIDGVSEVYSVAGRYDLAAVIRAKDNDHLADLVTGTLLRTDGIQKSETLFAFRVYSKHDLDRMFSL
jgi:DNA-binding Lrp family transcriptional regulator